MSVLSISGRNQTPTSGRLWVQPGSYTTNTDLSRELVIEAPIGGVTLTRE